MALLTTTRVDELQIPDSALSGLLAAGIDHALTLLARRPRRLADLTGAPVTDVRAWQCRAELLHVFEPDAAVIVQQAGVTGLSDLAQRPLSWLHHTLSQLGGSIDDDACAASLVMATRLVCTGSVTVIVVGADDAREAGVEVRYGSAVTESDTRGLARLTGLPLGTGLPLVCARDETVVTVGKPAVSRYPSVVIPIRVRFQSAAEPKVLDEFDGDVLPPLIGVQMRELKISFGQLRDGELVMVGRQLVSGKVQLVSRYRRFQAGRLLVPVAEADADQLPAGSSKGTQLTLIKGRLKALPAVASLAEHRAMVQLDREFGDVPRPETWAEWRDLAKEVFGRSRELGLPHPWSMRWIP
jgi:Domain of unknown function (DUF4332)